VQRTCFLTPKASLGGLVSPRLLAARLSRRASWSSTQISGGQARRANVFRATVINQLLAGVVIGSPFHLERVTGESVSCLFVQPAQATRIAPTSVDE
jgi:hypothetical protein